MSDNLSISKEELKDLLTSAVTEALKQVQPSPEVKEEGTPIEPEVSLEGLDPTSPQYKMLAMMKRYPPILEKQKSVSQQQAIVEREQQLAMLRAREDAKRGTTVKENSIKAAIEAKKAGDVEAVPKDFDSSPLTPAEMAKAVKQTPPPTAPMNQYQAAMATKFKTDPRNKK